MFSAITALWAPSRIVSTADLQEFVGRQSAFISQKCTVEYCRARAGLMWDKLFREKAFLEAMERCRWEAYAAVMMDVVQLAEAKLRADHGGDPAALVAPLTAMVETNLARFPIPAHRAGWDDVVEEAAARLARAQLAPPQPAHQIALESARRIYDVLPIHRRLRGHDYELVQNNLRFNLAGAAGEFERRADSRALAAALAPAA